MLPSDFAIVTLSAELAATLDCPRRVLIEAVELQGGAILQGFAAYWTERADGFEVAAWRDVPEQHRAEMERLFVETRKPGDGERYETIRHSVPATRPLKPCAPARYVPGRRIA